MYSMDRFFRNLKFVHTFWWFYAVQSESQDDSCGEVNHKLNCEVYHTDLILSGWHMNRTWTKAPIIFDQPYIWWCTVSCRTSTITEGEAQEISWSWTRWRDGNRWYCGQRQRRENTSGQVRKISLRSSPFMADMKVDGGFCEKPLLFSEDTVTIRPEGVRFT